MKFEKSKYHSHKFADLFLILVIAQHEIVNFSMMQYHQYSLTELEAMIPWERELYVTLLMDHIEKEKQRSGVTETFWEHSWGILGGQKP